MSAQASRGAGHEVVVVGHAGARLRHFHCIIIYFFFNFCAFPIFFVI